MDNFKECEFLSKLLSEARYESGKSQEFMAMSLGVSKNTIYNWEKGTSQPTIKQFVNWYQVLGINPTPYIIQFCNQDDIAMINHEDSDERIENALNIVISSLPIMLKRDLLYILYGTHGSSPYSVLQMIIADLHCPFSNRVNIARTIVDNYEIAEQCNTLTDMNHIAPDMDNLKKAVELGKRAAINNHSGYYKSNSELD